MSKKPVPQTRRWFTDEFKREAVQMLLDGHSAASVVERAGISHTNVLYRWIRQQFDDSGPVASSLDVRVGELEADQIAQGQSASVQEICDCFVIPRSSFYEHRSQKVTSHDEHTSQLTPKVMDIFWEHRRRYGTRRIIEELEDGGIVVSRRRVAKIM